MKTKVIFRIFQGEVLALFPTIAATVGKPWQCLSYAHIGQHGGADCYGVMRSSRPAKPSEYRELKQELRRVGYSLRIVQRCAPSDIGERRAQLEN